MAKSNRPPDVYDDCGLCDGNGWRPGGKGESPYDCPCCGGTGRIKR